MPTKEDIKRLQLHYDRLARTNTFEEFKREQLAYVHMLIQDYTKRLEDTKPKNYVWAELSDVWRR